jgi:hypothetical protein
MEEKMAKKAKKKKPKTVEVVGTPTAMLLPARNYKFKVYDEDYVIKVPRKGSYVEFDGEIYTPEDGDFDFLQYAEDEKAHIVYLPAISKVLFATKQYPDMGELQAFTPIALIIKEDGVEIVGNLIEMLKGE